MWAMSAQSREALKSLSDQQVKLTFSLTFVAFVEHCVAAIDESQPKKTDQECLQAN